MLIVRFSDYLMYRLREIQVAKEGSFSLEHRPKVTMYVSPPVLLYFFHSNLDYTYRLL